MASLKNNNSGGDSTGGFKTVAFGFDKNDVTLYIASLRKKMMQMEEEFQTKLSDALENPSASNEALKHEREVIRSEMEKTWSEKLNERNIILKQQQNKINDLEKQIKEKNETIISLKTQLSAVTSDSNTDSAVLSARAAKAYMQFTAELKSMQESIEVTLNRMKGTWRGEFEEEIAAIEKDESLKISVSAAFAENNVTNEPASSDEEAEAENATENAAEKNTGNTVSEQNPKEFVFENKEDSKPAASVNTLTPSFSFNDLLEEEDDPLKGIIADLSEDTTNNYYEDKEPVNETVKEVSENKTADKASEPENKPVSTEKSVPKPHSDTSNSDTDNINNEFGGLLVNDGIDNDLMGLMADVEEKPAPKPAPKPKEVLPKSAPKLDIDDELSSLLADDPDDTNIKPIDNDVAASDDFADLLSNDNSYGAENDIIISENESSAPKGEDLDVSLLSDIVIDSHDAQNGDLGQMIEEQDRLELERLGNLSVTEADENNAPVFSDTLDKAEKHKRNDDNPFDFSFLDSDSDDEDDMSTDASFPGIL